MKISFLLLAILSFLTLGCTDEDESDLELNEEDDGVAFRASCYGSTCNGKDPVDYGCTEISTIRTKACAGGTLELRYSKSCNAKWAKVTRTDGNTLTSAWLSNAKNTTIDTVIWSYMYSNMYNGNYSQAACAYLYPCKGDCDASAPLCCTAVY